MNRRALFGVIPFLAAVRASAKPTPPHLPEGREISRSFDARVWAKAFVAHVKQIPGLATDEGTMTGWFANALMCGYDKKERERQTEVDQAGAAYARQLRLEAVRGAVARGWCDPLNEHKEMDTDLAEAIAQAVMALAPNPTQIELQRGVDELERNAQEALANANLLNAKLLAYRDQMEAALV
jgi:hypothetical protein